MRADHDATPLAVGAGQEVRHILPEQRPGVAAPVQPRVGQQVAPLGYAVLRMLRPQLAEHMLHAPGKQGRGGFRRDPADARGGKILHEFPGRRAGVYQPLAGLRKGVHDEQQQGRPLAEQPTQPLVEQRAVGLPPERGGFEQDVRAAEVVAVFVFAQPVEVHQPLQFKRGVRSAGVVIVVAVVTEARAIGFEVAALRGTRRERVVLESVLAAQGHQPPAPEIVGDVSCGTALPLFAGLAPFERISREHLQVTVHRVHRDAVAVLDGHGRQDLRPRALHETRRQHQRAAAADQGRYTVPSR